MSLMPAMQLQAGRAGLEQVAQAQGVVVAVVLAVGDQGAVVQPVFAPLQQRIDLLVRVELVERLQRGGAQPGAGEVDGGG
ncbi:hypothetical protein FKK32_29815, partial [Klebsiella pneumoniae]|nr:hypothetical protein [Klebsiella pneumoniae]